MLVLIYLCRWLKLKKKKGSPILEEILLIGVAILIFGIIFGIILNLIDWAGVAIGDFFG